MKELIYNFTTEYYLVPNYMIDNFNNLNSDIVNPGFVNSIAILWGLYLLVRFISIIGTQVLGKPTGLIIYDKIFGFDYADDISLFVLIDVMFGFVMFGLLPVIPGILYGLWFIRYLILGISAVTGFFYIIKHKDKIFNFNFLKPNPKKINKIEEYKNNLLNS